MTYKEQNKIIFASYAVGVAFNFLIATFVKDFPEANTLANSIKTTTILTFWWLFYFKIGWRTSPLKWLLFRMNYNGAWFGTYESISADDKKNSGEIALRIQQDFLTISITSLTLKFQNYSYSELVKFDEKSNIHGINYTYSQQENNLFDISQRNGTSELTLKTINGELWLEGIFWTTHGTKGKISVKKISSNQIDTFIEAKAAS